MISESQVTCTVLNVSYLSEVSSTLRPQLCPVQFATPCFSTHGDPSLNRSLRLLTASLSGGRPKRLQNAAI